MLSSELAERLELALPTAREAGDITLRYFRRDHVAVELKADASPVTAADREAELHLRQRIAAAFPADGILGEEFGEQPGTTGYRWVLDPLDGTKSFIAGVPLYGTLVGVEHEGRGVVGVIRMPALDESVYAAVGLGAWYADGVSPPRRAGVSDKSTLAESLFCTTDARTFTQIGRDDAYARLQSAARLTRTWGDCYGYVLVATGRAEVMIDPKINLWDVVAVQPIIEAAGGTFTDFGGVPTLHSGHAIATNGRVLDEVLAVTRHKPEAPARDS